MNRVLIKKYGINRSRKWYEFWKPALTEEWHYLIVINGFVCFGEKAGKE